MAMTLHKQIADDKRTLRDGGYLIPSQANIREMARREYQHEGTCEIDDNATISYSTDGGAYVQAWLWVDFPREDQP